MAHWGRYSLWANACPRNEPSKPGPRGPEGMEVREFALTRIPPPPRSYTPDDSHACMSDGYIGVSDLEGSMRVPVSQSSYGLTGRGEKFAWIPPDVEHPVSHIPPPPPPTWIKAPGRSHPWAGTRAIAQGWDQNSVTVRREVVSQALAAFPAQGGKYWGDKNRSALW